MNTLSYRCIEDNGLSFELLVDGQPLGALVGARGIAIPYWIVENDLPYLPPHCEPHDPEIRIVCVCSCGEYGCCHTRCRMIREGDEIVLRDFDLDAGPEGTRREFRFSRPNFEAVIGEIIHRAREQ